MKTRGIRCFFYIFIFPILKRIEINNEPKKEAGALLYSFFSFKTFRRMVISRQNINYEDRIY